MPQPSNGCGRRPARSIVPAPPGAARAMHASPSSMDASPLRSWSRCSARNADPGRSPGPRTIGHAGSLLRGSAGNGCGDRGPCRSAGARRIRAGVDPARPRPRGPRFHVKRPDPGDGAGRSELSRAQPDHSCLQTTRAHSLPLRRGEAMFHVKQRLVGGVRPQRPSPGHPTARPLPVPFQATRAHNGRSHPVAK